MRLLITLILLFGATAAITTAQTPGESSVNDSRTIARASNNDCESELKIANQRLEKTLDALAAAENLNRTLQAEIESRKRLDRANEELLTKKDEIIIEQKRLIEIYERRKGLKISFLFGLVSIRKN